MARDPARKAKREERLRRLVFGVMEPAVKCVQGLFIEEGEPGHNPDAGVEWKECTVRTRAALILTQGAMAAERAEKASGNGPQLLGMVMMTARIESADEWEKFAAQSETRKVIDAVTVPALPAKDDGK